MQEEPRKTFISNVSECMANKSQITEIVYEIFTEFYIFCLGLSKKMGETM